MANAWAGGDPVERAVRAEIARVLEHHGQPRARVELDDALGETLALTSLDLVELTVALTARLGVDPFRRRSFTEIRTVGDLVRAYTGSPAPTGEDAELAASRRRGQARRAQWGMQP